MYTIIYSPKAIEDLRKLKQDEPAAYKKVGKFIQELKEHPKTGTGHPKVQNVLEKTKRKGRKK